MGMGASASTCNRSKSRRSATRRNCAANPGRGSTSSGRRTIPVGPLDFDGGFDDRSDRRPGLSELMSRGYEDAYHQFIEPVVGASGEQVGVRERL